LNRHLKAWGPAALWALVLFWLSELRTVPEPLLPLTALPSLLIHGLLYTVLGGLLAWGREGPAREGGAAGSAPPHALVVGAGWLYGALDEWHQSFVPGRTSAVEDWVADGVGVTAGYLLALLLLRRWRGREAGSPVEAPTGRGPDLRS
jgi:VanZ family protein